VRASRLSRPNVAEGVSSAHCHRSSQCSVIAVACTLLGPVLCPVQLALFLGMRGGDPRRPFMY